MKISLTLLLTIGSILTVSGQDSRLAGATPYYPVKTLESTRPKIGNEHAPETSLFSRWGQCLSGHYPPRKSMSLIYGQSYDPNNRHDFLLLSAQWRWAYEDFWVHEAPDTLYFRLEAAAGLRVKTEERGVISCGMFAQRYIDRFSTESYRPYIDGGIGIIYTDFQNKNQGLRVNFNPRVSLGVDITTQQGTLWFTALRLYHVSNAGLHDNNRGINAAMIVVGRYF